jgi:hypothetical protein
MMWIVYLVYLVNPCFIVVAGAVPDVEPIFDL